MGTYPFSFDIATLLVTFGFSIGITGWARRKFHATSFLDYATSRSLHLGVTPKVGGLGLLPSVCLGLLAHNLFGVWGAERHSNISVGTIPLLTWLAPAFIVYVVCVLSDRAKTELPAMARLFFFLLAAVIFIAVLQTFSNTTLNGATKNSLSTLLSVSPSTETLGIQAFIILSVLAFTNFFNFMDGIDGLAGSMGLIGFASLGAVAAQDRSNSSLGIAALLLSTSCLGFLCWNWPKAKVFMGDTGSTVLGFSATALGWMGWVDGLWHWSIPFLVFFPFWFDASMTLMRRLRRREKVWLAHREHFYQRAVLSLDGLELSQRHLRVLVPSILLMLVSSGLACAQHWNWFGLGRHQPWAALAIVTLIHGTLAAWVDNRYRKSVTRHADTLSRP